MDETRNHFGQAASAPGAQAETESTAAAQTASGTTLGTEASASNAPGAGDSPAVERFKSCRWRCSPDEGSFCTHRDVLPFAGKEGFAADSWCPDCGFYKLRRTPKKRERVDYTY